MFSVGRWNLCVQVQALSELSKENATQYLIMIWEDLWPNGFPFTPEDQVVWVQSFGPEIILTLLVFTKMYDISTREFWGKTCEMLWIQEHTMDNYSIHEE